MVYQSKSADETQKIAEEIAEQFKQKGGVIALSGELGAGKTTFTQGFAKALGINEKVISPTFVLIRQHQIPESERMLFHIDLYRLEGSIDAKELGLWDMTNGKNIILIEWAEKIKNQLPKECLFITIEKENEDCRKITL